MKDILRSVAMAFSMFSRFPAPRVEWKQENMRYMLGFLPLVGMAAGAAEALWWRICDRFLPGCMLFAAGMTALPVLLTGGIHMDGFMDTVDALSSHGDAEKKRAILKDPHTGAFAVLYCALYLLVSFALLAETKADRRLLLPVCLIPVISRCGSVAASLLFPVYGGPGLLKTFRDAGSKKALVFPVLTVFAVLAVSVASGRTAAVLACVCLAVEALCLLYVYRMSKKQFGGMSGDLAGFLLELSEIAMLFAVTVLWEVKI